MFDKIEKLDDYVLLESIFQPYVDDGQALFLENWDKLHQEEKNEIVCALKIYNRNLKTRFLLRIFVSLLNSIPFFKLQRIVLEGLKQFRFRPVGTKMDLEATMDIGNYLTTRFFDQCFNDKDGIVKGGCVSLTYDMDQPDCIAHLDPCLKNLKNNGLKACFNFLAKGHYELSEKLVLKVLRAEHEVGLHGFNHDLDFGNRSEVYLEKTLMKALKKFPVSVKGFRSPALSVSPQLMKVLSDLDFLYDSSIAACHPYHNSTGFALPYRLPGLNLIEMPVVLQDNLLFSDLRLSDSEALRLTKSSIKGILKRNGHAVINLHMYIEKDHEFFHSQLLKWLRKNEIKVLRMDECAILFKEQCA
nr:polysaccharide deacetylase family protein [uncultured Desulfobacter sp.]